MQHQFNAYIVNSLLVFGINHNFISENVWSA